MRKRDQNKLNMYKTVKDWIIANQSTFSAYPGFDETLAQFDAELGSVQSLLPGKGIVTSGIREEKEALRTALEKEALAMIKILKVHATRTNNLALMGQVDFNKSQLEQFSEQGLINRAEDLVVQANGALPDAPFMLTQARIDTLAGAKEAFEQKQTSVRQAIISRKDAGEQMEAHLDRADDLLKGELDLLLELAELDYPELYNQYKAARIIIDR